MSNESSSLILADEARQVSEPDQGFLFSPDEIPKIDRTKPKANYTGERLYLHRPDVYKFVVRLLAEPGISLREIERESHCCYYTIKSVAEREQIPITAQKKEILKTITRGVRLCAERVEELAPGMAARDAIIGLGVLTEKMQLLAGEATQIIERGPGGNIFERFNEFHRQFVKAADVIEVSPTDTGLEGKNGQQKALPAGDKSEEVCEGQQQVQEHAQEAPAARDKAATAA